MEIEYSLLIKLIKFSLVGFLNTTITLLSFFLLFRIWHLNYLISSVSAYSLGIINSYVWNKYWTFKVKGSNVTREFSKFVLINLAGLGLNTVLIGVFVELAHIEPLTAQILTVGIVLILNFAGNQLWVFRKRSADG